MANETAGTPGETPDLSHLGCLTLEESLAAWERGEALAKHCQAKLDGARARLDAAIGAEGGDPESS
ncbi:MAG: exodeoxyribonuclease VII small subunit [Catenulispora sp. 13_1_20CM_3_70_7]|nr:MAG: exodeoxyribonuclease VII small subunit [Catenulispora sp. 13_1_20CM_3_70_7]